MLVSARPGLNELGLRALSALVLAPIVVAVVWLGGHAFFVLVGLAILVAGFEWRRMTGGGTSVGDALGAAAGPIVVAVALFAGLGPAFAAMALLAMLTFLLAGPAIGPRVWRGAGVLYLGIPALSLVYLRFAGLTAPVEGGAGDPAGRVTVLVLLAIVWASDIGGYATGRLLGGPRLIPAISPSKTWSGAVGGTVLAGLAALVVYQWMAGRWAPWVLGVGLALAIVAQIGDLVESSIKRRFGVKDTGALIPGHGGILDRIDGLMAAAAAAALAMMLASSGGN